MKYKLTEENINKALKGFLQYSVEMTEEDLNRYEYQLFLDLLRSDIGFLTSTEFYLNLARFLDLYCVDYPELWVKVKKSSSRLSVAYSQV